MPQRLVCVAILLFWAGATGLLIQRDVLPDWLVGPPPDLDTVAKAGQADGSPTYWTIYVAEGRLSTDDLRPIGVVETRTVPKKDGWIQLTSKAAFNSAGLLKGSALAPGQGEELEIHNTFDVDQKGNLYHFKATVRANSGREEIVTLEGKLKNNDIEVRAQGPLPLMNWTRRFPYRSRGIVQNAFSPLDRMPGLHVGQTWSSQVVSPLTGQVQEVFVEVARKGVIHWDGEPTQVLEVVSRFSPMTARTWVRLDGLVLRQEVPNPMVKLFLERKPDHPVVIQAPVAAPKTQAAPTPPPAAAPKERRP